MCQFGYRPVNSTSNKNKSKLFKDHNKQWDSNSYEKLPNIQSNGVNNDSQLSSQLNLPSNDALNLPSNDALNLQNNKSENSELNKVKFFEFNNKNR